MAQFLQFVSPISPPPCEIITTISMIFYILFILLKQNFQRVDWLL